MSAETERLAKSWLNETIGKSMEELRISLSQLLDTHTSSVTLPSARSEWRATFNAALTGLLTQFDGEILTAVKRAEVAANLAIKCGPNQEHA